MSSKRRWVRISNCSLDFLSTCGERKTVYLFILVGKGMGPTTVAPVRLAVSTISFVERSSNLWSYPFSLIRILSVGIISFPLLDNLADDAGTDRSPTLTNGETKTSFHGDGGDQLTGDVDIVARHNHFNAFV